MIQSISISDPNNWIEFSIQNHFLRKSRLKFFKIQIQIFGLSLNLYPNIWIKLKIQNPFFIK